MPLNVPPAGPPEGTPGEDPLRLHATGAFRDSVLSGLWWASATPVPARDRGAGAREAAAGRGRRPPHGNAHSPGAAEILLGGGAAAAAGSSRSPIRPAQPHALPLPSADPLALGTSRCMICNE
eukprot:gene39793-56845_t